MCNTKEVDRISLISENGEKIIIHIEIHGSRIGNLLDDKEEERFAKAIELGLTTNAALDELARICCQSVSTFKRRFRLRYSISPHKWFIMRKLELAYKIASEYDISTTELTKICGFNNTSHFISLFRTRYGTTPGQLCKSSRERNECDENEPLNNSEELLK